MGLFGYTRRSAIREALVIALAIIWCVPAYVLITLALKTTAQTYLSPLAIPSHPKFDNFTDAWKHGGRAGLGQSMFTTAVITVVSVLGLILLGSLCAYAIARRPGKLSTSVYVLFVLGIMLPFQLAIIPVFVAMRQLHLTGTYPGIILLQIGIHMPIVVFFYTGFIRSLPKEYEEAARVDGAGLLRTWIRVVFPLLMPVTATVGILVGLVIWNDFFLSLIFLIGSKIDTLPLALYSFVGENGSIWNLIMAAVAISVAPVLALYLFAQKQLIRGFSGGIKGG